MRARAAAVLLLRFLRAAVFSGLRTAWAIVAATPAGAAPPPSALFRMRYEPMSAAFAALLGCLVSLTPGTTTVDVDLERRELLLHALDASDPEALVAGIRHDFERPLVALFGAGTR